MIESCHPGMSYLFQLHEKEQNEVYTSLREEVKQSSVHRGMIGEEMPYKLRCDWMITVTLLFCFIIFSYVIRRASKFLHAQFKSFFSSKNRDGLSNNKTASDARYRLFLIFQTSLLISFCIFDHFIDKDPAVLSVVPGYILFSIYLFEIILFFILKWCSYTFVNSVFFTKQSNKVWIESYFNVVIWYGFLLFPLVLLITYFDLPPVQVTYSLTIIFFLGKILLFCKCFSNFFLNFHGFFLLILYFCALEILPDFVLWKGIVLVNNCLVLNY